MMLTSAIAELGAHHLSGERAASKTNFTDSPSNKPDQCFARASLAAYRSRRQRQPARAATGFSRTVIANMKPALIRGAIGCY